MEGICETYRKRIFEESVQSEFGFGPKKHSGEGVLPFRKQLNYYKALISFHKSIL